MPITTPANGARKKTNGHACQPRNAPIIANSVTSPKPIASCRKTAEPMMRTPHTIAPPAAMPTSAESKPAQCAAGASHHSGTITAVPITASRLIGSRATCHRAIAAARRNPWCPNQRVLARAKHQAHQQPRANAKPGHWPSAAGQEFGAARCKGPISQPPTASVQPRAGSNDQG